ncbi:MAG: 50S ribosomal protein L15 [Holosporaceae bacterium]|jgi:large subunit ribosomal protein L15|nr:50S ribosomal protein L15 [Holosporaceae bacterium]
MSGFGLRGLKARSGIDKKALGRGIGSGCGKTCSYGHKGGKARSGRGAVSWFEGGQMPIYRRLPKRGFVSHKKLNSSVSCVNIGDLQRFCDTGDLSVGQEVNIDVLKKIGAVRNGSTSLRLLAKGELKVALQISVGYASDAATRGVEATGGKVQII